MYEKDEYHDRYRVFWINPELINSQALPTEDNVELERPNELQPIKTNKTIVKQLEKEPWLIKQFSIPAPTGQIIKAEPKAISIGDNAICINTGNGHLTIAALH